MNLLEMYCEFLKKGDVDGLCEIFAEDAVFHDEAPVQIGQKPIHLEGIKAIRQMFGTMIPSDGMGISNVVVYENAMRYDIQLGNMLFLALAVMKVENGRIKELQVVASRQGG